MTAPPAARRGCPSRQRRAREVRSEFAAPLSRKISVFSMLPKHRADTPKRIVGQGYASNADGGRPPASGVLPGRDSTEEQESRRLFAEPGSS
jgi:hypothetical protein